MSQVICDEHGFLKGFTYHDGFLEGFLIIERDAYIAIRSVTSERRVLTLLGVRGLSIEGLREGNIVLNLRVLSISQALCDAEVLRMLVERVHANPGNLGAEGMVFWLEASYGAEVIAICERVDVSELGWGLKMCRVNAEVLGLSAEALESAGIPPARNQG
jgi:hypothetical protein